ncbi:schwannomin-interacting 1-like isoform X1 [Labeo rohita]|uniref:Schwannomin-interacting 1-like isoform X1 n=1 Tax=Labeo rohita TaxID=84645 RepID=A0A498NLB9_LABRO|nr:schwannomin-interacting 1-like isoform X1 [Labeo rohita]
MEENPDSDRHYERTADDPSPSGQGIKQESEHSPLDDCDLPIMQWEDLSLRIAELERQEEERRKKAESLGLSERDRILGSWKESKHHSLHREPWADENDYSPCRVPVITFNSPKNLQLCFINNSESEEEDDEGASSKESSCEAEVHGSCSRGLKQEVKAALRALRDKLWAEQKEKECSVRS